MPAPVPAPVPTSVPTPVPTYVPTAAPVPAPAAPPGDPLRVALIGYGLAGRVIHRPLVQAAPGLAVTHVVTADPERRRQAAADVPGVVLLDSADQLWQRSAEVDVAVVAVPHAAHAVLAGHAVRHGLATVVDKPLAATAAEAEHLLALAATLGVPLTVFANRRWDSDTLTAAALLAEGGLGDVVRLESRFTRFRPQVADRWREDPGSGGVLLDLGPHLVDQALHLLGPAVELYAEVGAARPGVAVDDDCFLALRHASGARSHLWGSLAAPVPGPRLVLQGTRAGWVKDDLDGQETALRDGSATGQVDEPPGRVVDATGWRPVPSVPGDWGAFYRLLAVALAGGGPLPVPAEDGLQVLRVLEAARRSAERREVVALQL